MADNNRPINKRIAIMQNVSPPASNNEQPAPRRMRTARMSVARPPPQGAPQPAIQQSSTQSLAVAASGSGPLTNEPPLDADVKRKRPISPQTTEGFTLNKRFRPTPTMFQPSQNEDPFIGSSASKVSNVTPTLTSEPQPISQKSTTSPLDNLTAEQLRGLVEKVMLSTEALEILSNKLSNIPQNTHQVLRKPETPTTVVPPKSTAPNIDGGQGSPSPPSLPFVPNLFQSSTVSSTVTPATSSEQNLPLDPHQNFATPMSHPTPPMPVHPTGPHTPQVYHQDLYPNQAPFGPPSVCQVFNPDLQGSKLANAYLGLPKLKRCSVTGFNGVEASNFFVYSDWESKAPDLDLNALSSALHFTSVPPYVNLARIDPNILQTQTAPTTRSNQNKHRRQLYCGKDPAVALTPIYVTESRLMSTPIPDPAVRAPVTKFISGFLHGQEYDRVMGVLGMAFREHSMYLNLYHSTVPFSTIPQVPVYDASNFLQTQGRSFDLTECIKAVGNSSGDALDEAMASFGAERNDSEADGACAVIAHSVNVSRYSKDNVEGEVMNFNVLWVLILGWDEEQSDTASGN